MQSVGLAGRLAAFGAMVLMAGAQAMASTAAVMTLEGTASGAAQGSVKGKQPKKGSGPQATEIELLSVERNAGDPATGMAAGRRGPVNVVVTKAYDADSAILEQAAAVNQILREVAIVFETGGAPLGSSTAKGWKATGMAAGSNASSKTARELVLRNAQITEIQQTRNIQRITIEYQSVEVTNPSGKPVASDDWETP